MARNKEKSIQPQNNQNKGWEGVLSSQRAKQGISDDLNYCDKSKYNLFYVEDTAI